MVYITEDTSLPELITYLAIFISPISIFVNICQKKSVRKFRPDPYLAAIFNSGIWIFYCFLLPPQPYHYSIFLPDAFGLTLELTYVAIFFAYAPRNKRKHIIIALVVEAVLVATTVLTTLLFISFQHRLWVLRQIGGVSMFFLSASPLTIMVRLIQSRSIKYMPFCLSLVIFINGLVPVFSALIMHDGYPSLLSSLQVLLGLGQLILYACYFKKTQWNDDQSL